MSLACIVDGVSRDFLAGRLNDQRRIGEFCDIHLKIWDRTLPTHACILSASSPFFRGLICGDGHPTLTDAPREIDLTVSWTETQTMEDNQGIDCAQVVIDLIDYIYTGKIELREDSVERVVRMAETFMLDGLLALIKAYMDGSTRNTEIFPVAATGAIDPSGPTPRRRHCRALPAVLSQTITEEHSLHVSGDPSSPIRTDPTANGPVTRQMRNRKRLAPRFVSSEEEKDKDENRDCTEEDEDEHRGFTEEEEDREGPATTKRRSSNKNWFRMCRPNGFAFKCRKCDFVSDDPPAVRQHKLLHPGNSYVCVSCGYVTRFAEKLLSHLHEADHVEETRCSLCGMDACSREAFSEHLKRHNHPKIFFCEHCEQRFSSRWCLKTHSRKHATTRPHVCSTCNRGFKVKGALQAHAKTHGPPGSVKGFLCGHCGFRTAYKHNLLMHERMHSGDMVECPHPGCGHRSNSEYSIQTHMLIHSKERPYQCEICGANFSHPSNLRQHAKLHDLAANTIRCDLCDFTTLRVDKLRSHTRKVHGDGESN